jgi:tetratricopeptide (TPR) repeat protein
MVGLLAAGASARVWTDASGKGKIEAEYLSFENGKVKVKIAASGKVTELPLASLSDDDKKFVQQEVAKAEQAKEAEQGPPDRFTQAIKDEPANPENYINRGMARVNRKEKDLDGAIKDFSKALELDPKNAHAYNGRGLAYQKKNELVAAQNDFNEAIKQDAQLASAYKNRGENLRKLALDKTQSVPELDAAIDKWQRFWNLANKSNTSNTPWQPLHAIKGDVGRPAALEQMAKIDIDWAVRLERDGHHGDWGGHGGYGGHGGCAHGPGCTCAACTGAVCPHCNGQGCEACNSGNPAPPLGVYPPKVEKGKTITLVANASMLQRGMPSTAQVGQKGARGKPGKAPPLAISSVDFYRDADGDGKFNAENDQFLAADSDGKDGFSVEVSTANFPPGPQSYYAVPRGKEGTGSGASPEELVKAAESLEQAAGKEKQIADSCEAGKAQGLPADQCKGLQGNQGEVAKTADEVGDKVGKACPEAGKLLASASLPMKAVKNQLSAAEKATGDSAKSKAEGAGNKAKDAAEKLTAAAAKLREAAEAAKASGKENPGQAPASCAAGAPTAGRNEVVLAGAPGPGAGPGGGGGHGDDGDDDDEEETVVETTIERARDLVEEHDYDGAVVEYDRLLRDDPYNVGYIRDRAATHLLRGGYDYAVRDYNRLLQVKQEPDADLYYNRGCAYLAGGKLQEALGDFSKSIELNEVYSLAYNNRGATYARMGDFAKAIADFTKAIEIEPANRLAFRNRALAYKKLGEMQKAEADFAVVVKLEKEGADTVQK